MIFYRSTIGKKVIMAVTGVIWVGYVIVHMYGNLKIFGGPEYFNEYAEGLRHLGEPLVGAGQLLLVARVVLIVALVLHVWSFLQLYGRNRQARKTKYNLYRTVRTNSAAMTMRWGGIAILFFIIYHLMHLTWGVPGVHAEFIQGDPYHNMIVGFESVPVTAIYLVGVVALGFHLYHGIWSMFQTLGLNNQNYTRPLRGLAILVAVVVSVGFAVVPISVLAGFVA